MSVQLLPKDTVAIRIGHTHRFSCCDCGLTHDVRFANAMVDHGEMIVNMKITSNARSTAATRRGVALKLKLAALVLALTACSGGSVNVVTPMATASLPVAYMATVTWVAPVTKADGSPIGPLRGYRVYYAEKSGPYQGPLEVAGTSAKIPLPSDGIWFFVVTAVDVDGNESSFSFAQQLAR